MRDIGHFIGGKAVKGRSGRFGDVFDPNTGEIQAKVALAARPRSRKPLPMPRRLSRPGPPPTRSAARACCSSFSISCRGRRRSRQAALLRARQDHPRRQGRHPARRRGGGVRLRHSASAQGRIHRRRRARHRFLLDAPAARRRRRHHAVQFPGHDPDVEICAGASPAATRSSSSPPSAIRACRCGSPNCWSRPDCRKACSMSSTATRRRSTRCSPILASRPSALSARRRSPNTFIRPAARTESACNVLAAPRTI